MLDKAKLQEFIESKLGNTDCFLTDLKVSPDNRVTVEIDSDTGVDIDFCVALSRDIEEEFPTDKEDYELEVGSAGLTSPLKMPRQYQKYLGHKLEVWTQDGKKLEGELLAADDAGIRLSVLQKVKVEGQKRPVMQAAELILPYSEIRKAVYLLEF